jgi:2-keto-3-deoxy-L-rhamnonate aldolase RhmA
MVAVMVEDVEALDTLEGILATPHLDLCILGREDLAMSFGHPGEPDHPDVMQAAELLLNTAQRAGIAVGVTTPDGFAASELFARGFQLVIVSVPKLLAGVVHEVLISANQARRSVSPGVTAP